MKRVRDRLRGDLRLTITTLCVVFATIWILPFSVYRFATGDVHAGLLDLLIVLGIAIPASHALLTGHSELGIRIIALVCCFGCVAAAEVLGLVGLLWSYALLIFVFFVLPRNTAVIMSLATLVAIAIVADGALASTFEQVSFLASAALVALFTHVVATRYEVQRRQLESLAWIDPLTSAGNRRLLEIELSQANRAAAVERMLPALAILDLDHFKQINDRFSHEAGGRVLVQFTDLLRDLMRKVDRLYRYGGEEFVLLLPAADASGSPRRMGWRSRCRSGPRCCARVNTGRIGWVGPMPRCTGPSRPGATGWRSMKNARGPMYPGPGTRGMPAGRSRRPPGKRTCVTPGIRASVRPEAASTGSWGALSSTSKASSRTRASAVGSVPSSGSPSLAEETASTCGPSRCQIMQWRVPVAGLA